MGGLRSLNWFVWRQWGRVVVFSFGRPRQQAGSPTRGGTLPMQRKCRVEPLHHQRVRGGGLHAV